MITDGIIFDVDGTLWDSTPVVAKAWIEALKETGYDKVDITPDRLKGLFGLPMDDIIRDILPQASSEERKRVTPVVYRYEDEYLRRESGVVYPKLHETLRELAKRTRLFVVSNCQAGYVELFCEKTGLTDVFTDHLCPGDTGLLKADNIKRIVSDYDLKYPVYVGDTIMDEKACKQAGCPFVFAGYGFGKAENPIFVINEPMDLIEIVEEKGEGLCN